MTNEEIKKATVANRPHTVTYTDRVFSWHEVEKMLDQARRDEAVFFGKWIKESCEAEWVEGDLWIHGICGYTTEELYALYKP